MKHFSLILIFLCSYVLQLNAQNSIDSLERIFNQTNNDTIKLSCAGQIAEDYLEIQNEGAYRYATIENELAKKLNFRLNESYSLAKMGYVLMNMGNYPKALEKLLAGITIAEDPASSKALLPVKYLYGEDIHPINSPPESRRKGMLALLYQYVGILYGNATDHDKEKTYQLISRKLAIETGNPMVLLSADIPLGRSYLSVNMPDSALFYLKEGYELAEKTGYRKYKGSIVLNMARAHILLQENEKARDLLLMALDVSKQENYLRGMVASDLLLADLYSKAGQNDSVYFYIQQALKISNSLNIPSLQLRSYKSAAEYYRKKGVSDSILSYQNKIMKINDSLFGVKQTQLFQNIDFEVQKKHQIKIAEEQAQRNRIRVYSLLAGLTLLVCVALILFRNNRNKQKAYALLEKQKQETDFQRQKAEQALGELKSAQQQLIYAEKMASLGEMIAGIAHEIQNPLNFINNFSEVNKELADDLETEIRNANTEASLQISADIQQNMDKINAHGKRADAIVKSMLEHSQSSRAQKEATDINLFADEYLRLSYRAFQSARQTKDPLQSGTNNFNITIKTDLDSRVGKLNIVPQDLSRVLVNIFNNAFYAVAEKSQKNPGFIPEVSLTTKASEGHCIITVKDNGDGISTKLTEKIFQPFFTTKPTGQGTGLGLSLAYDIVKAHGGEIKVNSVEGHGAELIIKLPDDPVKRSTFNV